LTPTCKTKPFNITSLDKQTGQVILTVSDHLEWKDGTRH